MPLLGEAEQQWAALPCFQVLITESAKFQEVSTGGKDTHKIQARNQWGCSLR